MVIDGVTTTYPPKIASPYTFSNVQADHTIDVTFAPNPRVQIFYDGFDSGFSGWNPSGASRQTGAVPKNGTASIRLRSTDSMWRSIPTTGYDDIIVQFAWALTSNFAGENAYAEYSTNGGTSWTILSQINGPVTQTTISTFISPVLPVSADDNANFRLRFRIAGSSTADILYVDDVTVTGIPI